MALSIVKILFSLNILPVKEIMLHVKPVTTLCFMRGLSNKHCLLTFLVQIVLLRCAYATDENSSRPLYFETGREHKLCHYISI